MKFQKRLFDRLKKETHREDFGFRMMLIVIILIATMAIVIPVLAEYTGPNRTMQVKQCHDEKVLDGCSYSAMMSGSIVYKDNSYPPEPKTWGCTIQKDPCGNPPISMWKNLCNRDYGNIIWVVSSPIPPVQETQLFHWKEVCVWVTVSAPPATVSANVNCANGTNGWCKGNATVNISGSDPNPAYTIVAIEGNRDGNAFVCPGSNCSPGCNENGTCTFSYWAVSSYGDTSNKGSTTVKVDKELPALVLNVSGGGSGWTNASVSYAASATDGVSGMSSLTVVVNGANVNLTGTISGNGTHTLVATAVDMAGNERSASQTIRIDQVAPTVSLGGVPNTASGTVHISGGSGDDLSGVARVEVNTGNGWKNATLNGTNWQTNWNTNNQCNGIQRVQVRSMDNAGNVSSIASSSVKITNTSVSLTLPAQSNANNPINFNIDTSKVKTMTIRITDDSGNYPPSRYTYAGSAVPSVFLWNQKMGDGSDAPVGTYTMNVTIEDRQTCSTDKASMTLVVIENAPASVMAIETSTATPNSTNTPTPEPTETKVATETEENQPTATATEEVMIIVPMDDDSTPNQPAPAPVALDPSIPLFGAAATGLMGAIAGYQAMKAEERRKKAAEAKRKAKALQAKRSLLIKAGIDPTGMNTKEIDQLYKENEADVRRKVQEEKIAMAEAAVMQEFYNEKWTAEQEAKKEKEAVLASIGLAMDTWDVKVPEEEQTIGAPKGLNMLVPEDIEEENPEIANYIRRGVVSQEELAAPIDVKRLLSEKFLTDNYKEIQTYFNEDQIIEIVNSNFYSYTMAMDMIADGFRHSDEFNAYNYIKPEDMAEIYDKVERLDNVLAEDYKVIFNNNWIAENKKIAATGIFKTDAMFIKLGTDFVDAMDNREIILNWKNSSEEYWAKTDTKNAEGITVYKDDSFDFSSELLIHEIGHLFEYRNGLFLKEELSKTFGNSNYIVTDYSLGLPKFDYSNSDTSKYKLFFGDYYLDEESELINYINSENKMDILPLVWEEQVADSFLMVVLNINVEQVLLSNPPESWSPEYLNTYIDAYHQRKQLIENNISNFFTK